MSRIRSCNYEVILYPDNESHVEIFQNLSTNYNSCYILHDKDIDNGTLKKAHYHLIVKFPRQRDLSTFAKEIDISPNYIKIVRNLKGAFRYLIHLDDLDKFQYSLDFVKGALKNEAESYCTEQIPIEFQVCSLLELLDSLPRPVTYRQLLYHCCQNGLYAVFRQLGGGISQLLKEHNFNGKENE